MKKLTINEQIFLIAIWHLGENAYGVKIRDKIIALTGHSMMFGTVYNTLDKMVKKGYLTLRKGGEPADERGGYLKVFYTLTDEGKIALKKARELQEQLWAEIPQNAL